MAVKTVATLRTRFEGLDKPTQQDWTDLIDTMQSILETAQVAINTAQPVVVVADQAARLAAGPATQLGQRVKQSDNGLTYVKQQETGSLAGDWVSIGDSVIEIADVTGLQSALDSKLINYDDDITTGPIRARNVRLENVSVNLTGPGFLTTPIPGNGWEYAFRDQNFVFDLFLTGTPEGHSITVGVKNIAVAPIDCSLGSSFIVFGQPFPVTIPAGKWLVVTVTCMPDPGYGTGPFYFISYALEG